MCFKGQKIFVHVSTVEWGNKSKQRGGCGEEIKEVQTLNIPELLTEGNVANCCYLLLSESILFKMQGKTVSVRGAQVSRYLC